MKTLTQCPICRRYRCEDGDYVHLTAKEISYLILFGDKLELASVVCGECDEDYLRP